ncbi:SMI1/KNR4 family protein [Fictibacillus sp. UD]|uniref:SMI1/KNR4 family protein n=1 Tax=Fictibacillus sp. UD TaxID=3038777 RepID=UPI0037460FC1
MIFSGDYFDNYRLEDLTSEMIEAAEKKLKVKLPAAYVELMKVENGGELKRQKFVNDIFEDGFIEIEYLYGIGKKSGEGILIDSYTRKEWGLSNKFVYLYGDSHNWIALDYRRYTGDNPPVVYLDVDTKEKVQIADNFTEFISRLTVLEERSEPFVFGEEEFVREEVEEALLGGTNIYLMTAGIKYFGMHDEDLNWFLTQMDSSIKRMINQRPYEGLYNIDDYLNTMIEIIKKRSIDLTQYPQTKELFDLLTKFPPDLDDHSMIRKKSERIQHYIENNGISI